MEPFFPKTLNTIFSIPKRDLYSQLFPCSSNKTLEMEIFFDGIVDPNCWGKIERFQAPLYSVSIQNDCLLLLLEIFIPELKKTELGSVV